MGDGVFVGLPGKKEEERVREGGGEGGERGEKGPCRKKRGFSVVNNLERSFGWISFNYRGVLGGWEGF